MITTESAMGKSRILLTWGLFSIFVETKQEQNHGVA
jgi:hypothetical protein